MATRTDGGGGRRRLLFASNLFPDRDEPYRGLDNATLLHHLREDFEIRVLAPRPSLSARAWLRGGSSRHHRARQEDEVFAPGFVPTPYVPKVGSWINHRLMARRLRPELRRLRSEFGFELILCSWLYPDGCAMVELGRGLAVPVVLVSQGTDCHQYLKHPRRRRLIVGACNRARGVVTRSAELGRLLGAAGVAAGQLHTIYNGVDTSVFKPRPQADARAAVGYRGARSLLLFVGNLLPIKDPLFLLRAYGRLLATAADGGPDLVMVGKGSMRAEIEAELARLDIRPRVTLTGPLSAREVALWMSAADLLCMSSVNEGLPNVVLEAMASGLPIVSTDVGGIGELVDGHQSGLLVPAGDMDAYVAALQEQLGHDNAAPTTVGRDLSWAASAGRYAEILNSVK